MVVVVVVVIDVVSVGVMVAGVDTEGEEVEPKSDLIGAATATAVAAGVDVLVAVVDLKRLPPENNPTVAGWDVPAVLLLLLLLLPGRIVLDTANAVDF